MTMTDDKRCRTCRHWSDENPHPGWTVRRCDLLGVRNPEMARDNVVASDMGNCPIMTGPDFGCIHHEAKT